MLFLSVSLFFHQPALPLTCLSSKQNISVNRCSCLVKSSSDYHYRRAFWRKKIAFCLSWPWQEVQEEKAVLPKTLALINEFSHQPRNSHFLFIALRMWLSLSSAAVPRIRQKALVVKPRAKTDPVLIFWHDVVHLGLVYLCKQGLNCCLFSPFKMCMWFCMCDCDLLTLTSSAGHCKHYRPNER
ncbi:hypothetical protein QQF64_012602 [Cirrhinus molitorella]|uniref:Secreted protein n=1 Tax=Cirrhinus molitorella TaxID=172907 RepID=A0ABR3LVX8_9TELE